MKIIAKEFNVHNSLMIRQGKNTPLYFILLGGEPTTIIKFKIKYKNKNHHPTLKFDDVGNLCKYMDISTVILLLKV